MGHFEFALWYAQAAYDDYDIWAVNAEGLRLPADPGFGEFADGVEHSCFSRQPCVQRKLDLACNGAIQRLGRTLRTPHSRSRPRGRCLTSVLAGQATEALRGEKLHTRGG